MARNKQVSAPVRDEPKAAVPTRLPRAEMQSYKHLPPETWMEICRLVGTQTELARLARVNKYLESIASRPLYKNVTLRSPKALESFSATIAECPDRAASTQVLRLEWVEDERVLTPKSAPRWFMEMMENLRGGKVEHLALLVSPPVDSKTGVSNFDQAVHTHVKRMRLKGFTLPKSVRTLEAQAQLLHNGIVPVSPGQPLAPLVALSLHAGGGLHLTEWCFPALILIAKTLRRLRISLEDPEEHPLWFCGCITQPLSLANVEYLEVAHVRPRSKGPLGYSPQAAEWAFARVDVKEHLPALRVFTWIPAWGDVQDLKPGGQHRAFVEHVRRGVFTAFKIRTFAIVFPRERCVRFEASDEEPEYSIVPKNSFDDLDWI